VHDLIRQGYVVGEVLSTTLIGSGIGWGPMVEPYNAYMNDKKRRDDALDRARPRGGRDVSLPRRSARALGHDDLRRSPSGSRRQAKASP